MKIITIISYCLLSLTLLLQMPLGYSETISILSDKWYPINGEPNSSHPGYMIEIAETILNKQGHKLDYRLAPWKRSLAEVRQGHANCIVGAYKSDAPDFIYPKNSWGKAEFNFYMASDNPSSWTYKGIDSLGSMNLGVISGYTYSSDLDSYIAANRNGSLVQLASGEKALEKNIRKLLAKRLDIIISYQPVMANKLVELGMAGNIKRVGLLENSQNMYIACSPKKESSKHYTQLFSDGISELRASGELKLILDKYDLKDW